MQSMTKSLENVINQAKICLQKKQYSKAADLTKQLLAKESENTEALYILAVCQRYLGTPQDALLTLKRLKSLKHEYGRAYQEEGHNYRAFDVSAAIRAYQSAVNFNPTLLASWKSLAELFQQMNESALSQEAETEYKYWSKIPRELLSVNSFLNEGNLYKAEQLCRFYLQNNPKHVEAMRLLARIGVEHRVYDDAEFLLESCLEFEPDFQQARFDYVNVLHKRQKYELALEQAKKLIEEDSQELAYQMTLGNQHQALGDYDEAVKIYDGLINKLKDTSPSVIYLMKGHALKTIGQQDEAIEAYRKASITELDFGNAFWSLANLKTYRFEDDEIQRMKRLEENQNTGEQDRIHLCFAIGKALEDKNDYEKSFNYYEKGNLLKKTQLRYSADAFERECQQQMDVCTSAFFEAKGISGNHAQDPIFIVGLPRAGSTLLEQILSSHSMVDGTLELPNIMSLSHRLNGRNSSNGMGRYPSVLKELDQDRFKKFGDAFLSDTQIYRKGAPFFIDKMPNNFRHIGLIHSILPNAKIIDARRHPMACCFSGFKQLFAEGQEFTYGLEEVGRYYKDYIKLMSHWDEVLPGKILRVQYEDVVSNLEQQVHRILDYCGLPFEDACLDFHKTERSVRTASSEQVRQPIFKSGLEQWSHFEEYLEPLESALGSALTEYIDV